MNYSIIAAPLIMLAACNQPITVNKNKMSFTESEILSELDLALKGKPGKYFPQKKENEILYNFPLDLEHGYCVTAGSKIHLYADKTHWAIVFEKSGYMNRSDAAQIELDYVGNCINYNVQKYEGIEYTYISNTVNIDLITFDEYQRITNTNGSEMETFELINPHANEVKIRGRVIPIVQDAALFAKLGIKVRQYDNSENLLSYGDLLRYIYETHPNAITATEGDIKAHLLIDLPKLMSIDQFHYESVYNKNPLSSQELYQLIAKVLTTRDTSY